MYYYTGHPNDYYGLVYPPGWNNQLHVDTAGYLVRYQTGSQMGHSSPTYGHHGTPVNDRRRRGTARPYVDKPLKSSETMTYRKLAEIATRFLFSRFTIRDDGAELVYLIQPFIEEALRATKAPYLEFSGTLMLLQRLREYELPLRIKSGQRLFLPAFMLATKFINDNAEPRLSSWSLVGGSVFHPRHLGEMERQMMQLLGWDLNLNFRLAAAFGAQVIQDFAWEWGPYPPYNDKKYVQVTRGKYKEYQKIKKNWGLPFPGFNAPMKEW